MNEEDIFQLEESFEIAFSSIFRDAGCEHSYRSREPFDMDSTPWVESKFLPGAVNEKYRHYIDDTKPLVYAAWFGSILTVTVTTHRKNNGTQHKILIGKIRLACQRHKIIESWPATAAGRIHRIADIREKGSVNTTDDENELDKTEITFHLTHNVSETAWT